jgi:tetratricopeptide (TPR) repeat protein
LWFLGGAVLGLAAPTRASAQVPPGEEGRASFQRGRAHFDAGRFAEALEAFQASLQALPSPNTRLYLGRSLRALGRTPEAFTALQEAARDALERARVEPRYTRTAEVARAEADALRAALSVVTVLVPEPVTGLGLTLNGAPLELSRVNTEVPLAPGMVTLEARAPGHHPWQTAQPLAAGQSTRIEVRLLPEGPASPPPPPPEVLVPVLPVEPVAPLPTPVAPVAPSSTLRVVGYVSLGVGLLAGLGGVLAGLSAQSVDEDLSLLCPARCPRNLIAQDLALGESRAALSTAGFITAGALVGVGLVLILASPSRSTEPYRPHFGRIHPWVDPAGAAGLGLQGRF